MAQSRDDSTGRYERTVTDRDILHFFDASERGFFASSEVADHFNRDRTTMHRRLSALTEAGALEKITIGGSSVVWSRPRDVVSIVDEGDGYSIIDTTTGVASQGETRADALRMLADALDAHEGRGEPVDADGLADELGVDLDDEASVPPWLDS